MAGELIGTSNGWPVRIVFHDTQIDVLFENLRGAVAARKAGYVLKRLDTLVKTFSLDQLIVTAGVTGWGSVRLLPTTPQLVAWLLTR